MRRANAQPAKGLLAAEFSHHMRDEQKGPRSGINGGQGLSQEDESRVNNNKNNIISLSEYSENVRRLSPVEVVNQVVVQQPPQQPQGPLVQWERFLPLRSLKVLLVENDDSTRHLVSALLRNCSYEVVAVANGLEAWRVLEDQTNRIDLVLTEVVMPCLTGVGLLSLIKSHKTCKNVPVIMMSSNDSMGIVFKCLSNGAVDFLVKPIRKNELKNLWQHVWRKCHSSSGSASESGIQTKTLAKSKSAESSENNNNSGSNGDEYGSTGLNAKYGSDNGSGTQTSWSKKVVEIDSPQPTSPCDQFADPPDSTCAQVVYSKPDEFSNNWIPRTECRKDAGELDSCHVMGKDLEIGISRKSDLQHDDSNKKEKNLFDLNTKKDSDEMTNVERISEVADFLGGITSNKCNNIQMKINSVAANEVKNNEMSNKISNNANEKVANCEYKEMPSLELRVKRQRDAGSAGQERNVLRHSDLSAFSRYNTSTNTNQTGNVGSCSLLADSLEAAKTDSMHNLQSNGTPNQRSNGSSNDDMGSTTNNVVTKPDTCTDKQQIPNSTINIQPSSGFQPIQQSHTSTTPQPDEANPESSKFQVQHHHHYYYHHHHHIHNTPKQKQKVGLGSTCGPPDVMNGSIEGNAANYGINSGSGGENGGGSGSGSGVGVIGEGGGMNMGSDNGGSGGAAARNCGSGSGDDGSGSGTRSAVDQNRLTQREAALHKFRQKRKDRCFEKKVRYQSRKRLAEQKPRVRGQFVRKTNDEPLKKDGES